MVRMLLSCMKKRSDGVGDGWVLHARHVKTRKVGRRNHCGISARERKAWPRPSPHVPPPLTQVLFAPAHFPVILNSQPLGRPKTKEKQESNVYFFCFYRMRTRTQALSCSYMLISMVIKIYNFTFFHYIIEKEAWVF